MERETREGGYGDARDVETGVERIGGGRDDGMMGLVVVFKAGPDREVGEGAFLDGKITEGRHRRHLCQLDR